MKARGTPQERTRLALTAVLPTGLRAEVVPRPRTAANIFDVTVIAGSGRHGFLAGWAGEGWPGDVDKLLLAASELQVVFAKHLSDGARANLASRRIGWVDEAGQADVSLRSGLVISRELRENAAPAASSDRWTPTMLSATEAIFAGIPPMVEAIEISTGMSRGAAANAMSRLEQRGLLIRPGRKRGRGVSRQIADVDALIDDYANAASGFRARQQQRRIHRLMSDPLEVLANDIGPNLTAMGARWALTGVAASILLAPYLSDATVLDIYVDKEHFHTPELPHYIDGREVSRGHVIEVRELPTPMSERGPNVDGIHVALPVRVYADLMTAGGRTAEAAQHLREVAGVGPAAN